MDQGLVFLKRNLSCIHLLLICIDCPNTNLARTCKSKKSSFVDPSTLESSMTCTAARGLAIQMISIHRDIRNVVTPNIAQSVIALGRNDLFQSAG